MDDYEALVEFLKARFTEDETLWNNASTVVVDISSRDVMYKPILPDPANQALSDLYAKRKLLDVEWVFLCDLGACNGGIDAGDIVLRWLAWPYSDHADYREGWKP